MKKLYKAISSIVFSAISCGVFAHGVLENPEANIVSSGIGIISGWHCTAKEITVKVDGVNLGRSSVGSVRNDTRSVCGDVNNGFSLLFNYNDLTPGKHVLEAYADGKLLTRREFSSVRSGGISYRRGAKKIVKGVKVLQDNGKVNLAWRDEKQNFVITRFSNPVFGPGAERLRGNYILSQLTTCDGKECFVNTRSVNKERYSGTLSISSTGKFEQRLKAHNLTSGNIESYALDGHLINMGTSNDVFSLMLAGLNLRILKESDDLLMYSIFKCKNKFDCFSSVFTWKKVN